MKKILLLGGSAQQIVAIETAKKMGYYTVLCDYLYDNPGQFCADRFYMVSTTNKEEILKVALKEDVDGVLAYASDPAAPTAAYVAMKMGLPSNPYRSVEILCNKDRFRKYLKENGFNAPRAYGYSKMQDVLNDINNYSFPIIIKPVDSSGSKGVTVLENADGLYKAIEFAFSFSRSHRIIIEEFIKKKHPYLIGGDIFIENGKIIMWGLMNCHRDCSVNELVPVGKSYPVLLDDDDLRNVKNTLQKMVTKLSIISGAMNVEVIVDEYGNVWPIDVGPRNGGNMIPDLLSMIFGIDVVKMSIQASMGEKVKMCISDVTPYCATHNLHSSKNGIYKGIKYSTELEKYIVKKCEYKHKGEQIEYFDNAAKALGIIFMKFGSREEMMQILSNINQHIEIEMLQ